MKKYLLTLGLMALTVLGAATLRAEDTNAPAAATNAPAETTNAPAATTNAPAAAPAAPAPTNAPSMEQRLE